MTIMNIFRNKRLVFYLLLFALWAGVGAILLAFYKSGGLNSPKVEEEYEEFERKPFFEIMPRSDDKSYVEED